MSSNTGTVILNGAPNREIRKKVALFLLRHVKNLTEEKVTTLLDQSPVVLNRHFPEKTGKILAQRLNDLGASASFIPNAIQKEGSGDAHQSKSGAEALSATAHSDILPDINRASQPSHGPRKYPFINILMDANKEIWLILSMVTITGLINYAVASHYLLLSLYMLPTIMSAYFFGRRHAVLTAVASILLVVFVVYLNPTLFTDKMVAQQGIGRWYHIFSWACILIIIAYAMGSLYKKNRDKMVELRQTYRGLLIILRHFISKDEYTENHCLK